jgi:CAAX prenyl protease-like protein
MALMMVLPHDAPSYAVRTGTGAVMLCVSYLLLGRPAVKVPLLQLALGTAAGLGVFALWIAPEHLGFGTGALDGASPFDPEVCGWPLTLVSLVGSAFVIAVAEELFFRRWLMDFAGFWWMVALFAIEHDRWAVGALAGAAYGLLAMKKGLAAAIVAHIVTNLVLGLWVVFRGYWQFW